MNSLRPPHTDRQHPELRAVALIDARYLRWLARLDEGDEAVAASISRHAIGNLVSHALARMDLGVNLLRTYWYTDLDDQAVHDDQTVRLLPSPATDGGAVVRHIASDLQALVASGRIDLVLVASDDDRLSVAIEAAKLAGLTVCLLADERALSMPRLMQQDPNWAHLLREADRRVVVRSADLALALASGSTQGAGASLPRPSAPWDEDLEAVVKAWWDQVPEESRESLREELPALRGLPPEVDRELLLRSKNMLSRGLNFPEKRMLREYARRLAMGAAQPRTDVAQALPADDEA